MSPSQNQVTMQQLFTVLIEAWSLSRFGWLKFLRHQTSLSSMDLARLFLTWVRLITLIATRYQVASLTPLKTVELNPLPIQSSRAQEKFSTRFRYPLDIEFKYSILLELKHNYPGLPILMNNKRKLKVVVIGDPQSGKSSLIRLFLNKGFNQNIERTQEYQLSVLDFLSNGTDYSIQLWDCGTRHLDNNQLTRSAFFRNASAAFLCFDISEPKSLNNVPLWIQEAYQNECYLIHVCGMKRDICIGQPDMLNINSFLGQYQLEDRLKLFSGKEYRQKMIKGIFHEIDFDAKLDRSTVVKAGRFSRMGSFRKTHVEES